MYAHINISYKFKILLKLRIYLSILKNKIIMMHTQIEKFL